MKKVLVLLLILVMLIPMVLVKPVGAAVSKDPFYALGWTGFESAKYPSLHGMPTLSVSYLGENPKLSYDGATILYGSYTDEQVTKLAEAVKTRLDARPAGARYMRIFGVTDYLKLMSKNVLFLDDGVALLKDLFSALFNKMAKLGCPLDGVVLDIEYFAMSSYYLSRNSGGISMDYYTKNKQIFAQIVKNPQYKKRIRPLLVEYGFPFWPNPAGEKSEIFSMYYDNKGADKNPLAQNIWNTVVRIHQNKYMDEMCYEPLKAAYPDASMSDYQSTDGKAWLKLAGVGDDGVALTGGNSIKVGDTSTYSYYYTRPSAADIKNHKKVAGLNEAYFVPEPFTGLLYDINFTRYLYDSTDTQKISPWIANYNYLYSGDERVSTGNTPYYSDLIYHLGMFNPQPFLHYGTKKNDDPASLENWDKNSHILQDIFNALNDVAGFADRKPISMPINWNSEYVLTGMYCGGRNLWRITPNTSAVSRSAFLVKKSDPTFTVNGQTVTFPGGKILPEAVIKDNKGKEIGSVGYWVETKAGVTPVVTTDADRYAKYPSYQENFDSYANGTLTAKKMKEDFAWEIQGTAKVANKALALTGDVTLKNIVVPGKITAGDSYAEQQTWEMTVTIPSDLAADAEIQLLQYEGKGGATDGGIKIKDGKLYYSDFVSESLEYQELTKLNPGTYTVRRVMDFSDPDNFTYDIYLLDSKGKEITNSKNIAASPFTAITSINFSTKKAGTAVAVDNYKLYPSGLAADFELYDAGSGKNILGEENDQARSRSTAYRLSWLNGTKANKTVTVVAAIYEGGNLKAEKAVKTLTMKPGCDGIDTGVVEVKAGQSVHVYLKNGTHQDVTYTEPGATESGSKTEPTKENNDKATSATKATTSSGNKPIASDTKATQPVRVTKTPTRASRPTKATQPGQTLAPGETLAPDATETTKPTAPIVETEIFEGGIQELLDVLIEAGLDSVDKVKAALAQNLLATNQDIPAENIVHYDVKADEDDIPTDGKMTIILPYPAGTDTTYTFYVAHMFTTNTHGKTPGEIEMPEVTNTDDGIQFEVTGLSPITVGWIAPDPDATDATDAVDTPKDETEGDNNLIIIAIAAVAVLAIAGGLTFILLKKKKPAAAPNAPADEPEEIDDLNNDPEA